MTINAHTKIAAILKQHPDALEAIISISDRFSKLRNPLLRKLMASRTSLAMASKIGGCSVDDFFTKLEPLGFRIERAAGAVGEPPPVTMPAFMHQLDQLPADTLDVRTVIENGRDPFSIIMEKVKAMKAGAVLKLINTFEPAPLITILGKQGFECFAVQESENLVNTYFYKKEEKTSRTDPRPEKALGWDEMLRRFENNLVTVDVRQLEMPLPLFTLLGELEKLPDGKALFVYHKRIPVFLLPELQEKNLDYRIREISEGEVHMLIFKP